MDQGKHWYRRPLWIFYEPSHFRFRFGHIRSISCIVCALKTLVSEQRTTIMLSHEIIPHKYAFLQFSMKPENTNVFGLRRIGNLRNAAFCDGNDDRMSFLLPDDVFRFLHTPSHFGADLKIEILPLFLECEWNIYLLGSKEYFLLSLLCD